MVQVQVQVGSLGMSWEQCMSTGSSASVALRDLMADVYPGVPIRGELEGRQTLLSIDKARRLLGYDPQHSWRDHVPSTTSGNSTAG